MLSDNRAEAVCEYFKSKGCRADLLTPVGKSDTEPLLGDKDSKRVEIKLTNGDELAAHLIAAAAGKVPDDEAGFGIDFIPLSERPQ